MYNCLNPHQPQLHFGRLSQWRIQPTSRCWLESLIKELVICNFPCQVLIEMTHDVIDLVLIQHHIGQLEHRTELGDGEVAVILQVQFAECATQVLPVSRQLVNRKNGVYIKYLILYNYM